MWYNIGERKRHMKLNVVDIPDGIGGKTVDGAALLGYLEDVKTLIDSAAISGNDHPIVQKTQTLMMLVQLLWNEKDELEGQLQEANESLNLMTERYKDLLARYDRHLDEELAFQKEMANTASEMMDKFALKP